MLKHAGSMADRDLLNSVRSDRAHEGALCRPRNRLSFSGLAKVVGSLRDGTKFTKFGNSSGLGECPARRRLRMKIFWPVALAGACLAMGAAVGYKLALVHEHDRLARNKALVRRVHAEVWSEPNVEKATKAARELYTPNFVLHDWRGDDASGMDGLVKGVADEHATFLDLSESPEEIVAESDLVVDRFITKARQARDLDPIPHHSPGVPNRGKPLRMPEMEMFRVVDGKAAEPWLFPDIWGAHAQLGLYDPDHWTESICGSQQKSK